MEIRIWLCFVLIKCVFIQCIYAKSVSLNKLIAAESQQEKQLIEATPKSRIPGINAKSVSLNELIAAESQQQKQLIEATPKSRIKESRTKSVLSKTIAAQSQEKQLPDNSHSRKITDLLQRSSLSKRLASHANIKRFKKENTISGDKIISPLKYRKAFLIKSPLRPKKLKLALKSRHKRKNQATKREINGNEGLKHKYIPLLKSLSMLVDNLLGSDESDSSEVKRKTYKRNRYYFEDQFEPSYEQSSLSSSRNTKPKSKKKTTTPPPTFSTEVSSDAESFTNYENNDDSTYRSHKSVPVLLPRNTFSLRRDDYGPSQRSGASYNGDPERDIARHHRDYEYNTGNAENKSCEEGDENNTYSVTRNDASGIRYARTSGNGNNTRDSKTRKADFSNVGSKIENANDTAGANQFEVGRNKTESKDSVREPIRRLRGFISEDKIGEDERLLSEPIRHQEVREESILNATKNSTSDKRITHQNGSFTTKDEKIRTGNETVTLMETNLRQNENYSMNAQKKRPVVLIFDGYSVTRDKNGENKLSGKTIHIRS